MNIPVGLYTRRPWLLIHSALGERLAMPAMLVGIENERTRMLAYPATVVLNSFSLGQRLAMPAMPGEIEHLLPVNVPVSLHTRRPWFLIHSALGERLAMPAMLGEIEHSTYQ